MNIFTLRCQDKTLQSEVSKCMLERANKMSEIFFVVCVAGAIVTINVVSRNKPYSPMNPTTTATASLLGQIFGIFSLICLIWNIVKRTRFSWLLKGLNSLMILTLAV